MSEANWSPCQLQSGRDEEGNSEQLQAQMRGSFRRNMAQS